MARVAEALKGIDVIADAAVRHDIVNQCEQATWLERAMDFAEEVRNRLEMVRPMRQVTRSKLASSKGIPSALA